MTVALAAVAGVLAAAGIVDLAGTSRRRRASRPRAALIALGRWFGAAAAPPDLAERLAAAGQPMGVADAMALKAGAAVAGALLGLLLATTAPGRLGLALPPAGTAAGFIALDGWLRMRTRARAHAIAIELPDVLDLLRVALEAGLPPTRALAEVGRRHAGVLARELARAAAQTQVGIPRHEALATLDRRAPGLTAVTAVLDRADRLGAPPAEALAALARDARETRARARPEPAARAAPKIQLIVALLLVPSVMLLVAAALAPALLHAV
ncbi:MAG: tight adherence protein [Solirubrobacteraceae bacterium]|nr:tight adherence protein [Solirubrobacteraceae bacterium]